MNTKKPDELVLLIHRHTNACIMDSMIVIGLALLWMLFTMSMSFLVAQ